MRKLIITKNETILRNLHRITAKQAHVCSLEVAETTEDFLKRDDIKRFDVIMITGNDKLKAIDDIRARLPQANLILINDEDEIVQEADVMKIVDLPITEEEFIDIFEEVAYIINNNPSENVVISCFKALSFKRNIQSRAPIEIKWRTNKAKELFSYLLVNANSFQSKKTIQQMFWRDLSEKSVTQQLYSTVYEIRKTIEKNNIPVEIVNSADKYMLKLENTWIDYKVFEDQLKSIRDVTEENSEYMKDILDLYTGHLFESEEYGWAFNKSEELRFLWIIYMEKLRDFYVDQGSIHEAIMLNLNMRQQLPNNKMVEDNLNNLYSLIGEPGI